METQDLGVFDSKLKELTEVLTSAQDASSNLGEKYEKIKSDLTNLNESINNLINKLKEDAGSLTQQINQNNEEIRRLKEQISNANSQNTQEIENLNNQIKKLNEHNDELISRIRNASQVIQAVIDFMKTIPINKQNNALKLGEIEKLIENISRTIQGQPASQQTRGGTRRRKHRRTKKRHKKQKGGFVYKKYTKRKTLNSGRKYSKRSLVR